MKMSYLRSLIFASVLLIAACTPFQPIDLPSSSQEPPCDEQVPIVFAHGFLASGDTYAKTVQLFIQNGYCPDRLFAFDWNTIGFENNEGKLDQFINEVLRETGAEQVFLAGHSAGSGLSYRLMAFAQQSLKIKSYAHLGGNPFPTLPGPNKDIPTVNIWSKGDFVVAGGDIPGATNVELIDKDHFEVASSPEAFAAMYEHFLGEAPALTNVLPDNERLVKGKLLSFGENIPSEGGTVEIYELDPADGSRISPTPVAVFTADEFGFWGPFAAKAGTYYEFLASTGKGGDRPVHYYTEPFFTSNQLLYLRTYPPPGSLGRTFLSGIPSDDGQSVSAFFGSSQSVVSGRDVLTVNGEVLSTPDISAAELFTVALFLYDDGDEVTELTPVGAFQDVPFLSAVDFFVPTDSPAFTEFVFNGRSIRVPNWKSGSEGVSIAIFN